MTFKELLTNDDLTLFSDAEPLLGRDGRIVNRVVKEHFVKAIMMYDDDTCIGRFALYHNPALRYQQQKTICIGNYECIDSAEVAKKLLQKAADESISLGASWLIGPMNGSTWENYRLADNTLQMPFFMEPQNQAWYPEQFMDAGFEMIAAYYSAIDDNVNYERAGIRETEKRLTNNGYIFRPIDMEHYENELDKIYECSLTAFSRGFLYTPATRDVFMQKYMPLKPFINPRYVWVAEETGTKATAGFIFCFPDFNAPLKKHLVLKTIARNPGKRTAGIGEVLGDKIYKAAYKDGYKAVIHALMHNRGFSMNHSMRRTHLIWNTYSLYALKLT